MTESPLFDLGKARLGEMLVSRGVITSPQLDEALTEQKSSGTFIGRILVAHDWASEEEVARALSEQVGLAYVDLASQAIEPEALALLQEPLCRAHQAVPLFSMGESLTVAMANPLDSAAVEEMEKASRKHIRPVFATPSAIRRALEQGGPASAKAPEAVSSGWAGVRTVGLPAFGAEEPGVEPAKLKAVASLAPVIQMVGALINEAVAAEASDIHLEPSEEQFRCRFRVDGILRDRPPLPKEYQAAIISRIKIMVGMDIAEKRLPQDGRVQLNAAGRAVDLRVSTFPTLRGENVVIRVLDKERALFSLEKLGFSEETFALFSGLITKPHGILLVTGPTGSGKTSTLYAALNRLNQAEKNIMTLEDPVEYELPLIRQSQVNLKAGLTFATGLRSMLRQDPDIILIGEIRDKETADIAIHASLTGHLVFSTLHTNDAAGATTRLVDMGVEPFLAATSLIGILAQRLVRTLCGACKAPYRPPAELMRRLGITLPPEGKLFKETGCPRCRQTGYHGRLGLFELLVPTEKIQDLIVRRAPAGVIQEEAVKSGMTTLRQDGILKLKAGVTSIAEVLRLTGEEQE